jgi:hypothetical protein
LYHLNFSQFLLISRNEDRQNMVDLKKELLKTVNNRQDKENPLIGSQYLGIQKSSHKPGTCSMAPVDWAAFGIWTIELS